MKRLLSFSFFVLALTACNQGHDLRSQDHLLRTPGPVKGNVAGNEAGNGGNGVLCRDAAGKLESVELLDYYEAGITMPELRLDLGGSGDETDRARFVLQRLARLDRPRAEAYERKLAEFLGNVRWIKGKILGATNDFGYVPLSKENCGIEPIAVFRPLPLPEARPYMINEDLWNRLSLDHRAGLMLHEIAYGEALKLGHKNSINSRYFTMLLSSTKMDTLSAGDYAYRLGLLGFSGALKPQWVTELVRLPGATAGNAYVASLAPFAHHPGGSPLVISVQGGPAWLTATAEGRLQGTPPPSAVGDVQFTAVASDGVNSATTKVVLVVGGAGGGPVWTENPVELGVAREDVPYSFDLKAKVTYSGTERLLFHARQLPAWLTMSHDGVLRGVPRRPDVGSFTVGLSVVAGEAAALTQGRGTVAKIIKPIAFTANPITLPDAEARVAYLQDLTPLVFNPEGVPVTFRFAGGPAWLVVSPPGQLTGTPSLADVGAVSTTLVASAVIDGQPFETTATVIFRVRAAHLPPFWSRNPVTIPDACVNQPYSVDSLAEFVNDPGGSQLTLSKITGASWVAMGPSGILRGIPSRADVGENRFVVRASNVTGLSADVTVVVIVKPCRD